MLEKYATFVSPVFFLRMYSKCRVMRKFSLSSFLIAVNNSGARRMKFNMHEIYLYLCMKYYLYMINGSVACL